MRTCSWIRMISLCRSRLSPLCRRHFWYEWNWRASVLESCGQIVNGRSLRLWQIPAGRGLWPPWCCGSCDEAQQPAWDRLTHFPHYQHTACCKSNPWARLLWVAKRPPEAVCSTCRQKASPASNASLKHGSKQVVGKHCISLSIWKQSELIMLCLRAESGFPKIFAPGMIVVTGFSSS